MSKEKSTLTPQQKVIDYFTSIESRWGYSLLLKGVKHFGYYPVGQENISMREAQRLMVEKLYEELSLPSHSFLLDAGCGEGEVALYLADKYGYQIKGVDLLDVSIEKARKKQSVRRLEDKVEFQVMDYTDSDFSDGTFDGIYTMETLVHVPDYKKALQEFYRVLEPKGKLVLFEYSICPLEHIPLETRKILQIIIEESGMHSLPYFLHGKFPEILQETGFTNVSVENITQQVTPMLKRFHQLAFIPYKFIKLFGLQRRFVNATAGAEGYENLSKKDYWRYNIVTASKP